MEEQVAHGALRGPNGELMVMAPAMGQRMSPVPVFTIVPPVVTGTLCFVDGEEPVDVVRGAGVVLVMTGFGAGLVIVYPSRSTATVNPDAVKLCPAAVGATPGTTAAGPVVACAGSAAAAVNSAIAAAAPVIGTAARTRDRSERIGVTGASVAVGSGRGTG
ncbi:hypothetical protein [Curtobacterium sp. HSID17257]|uniref:hypothetical protein n=1 Tax=Curtobacterium sp. HSID17257 TaxID=2419510 RepID=UPI0013A5E305|nr:hypothetical protein [Curtobacterium sp. HSID17257]